MANLHSQEGNPAAGLALLRKARELDPENREVLFKVAALQEEQGQEDGAIATYQEIVGRERDNRKALRSLRDLYVKHCRWKDALDAQTAHFEIEFPYFITKKAPVSAELGKMEYACLLTADSSDDFYTLEVRVPVMSLCPCSKEISAYGAHNQRSILTIKIKARGRVWIEDLVQVAEASASSEVYSLLKREDEKYITERAYDNPVFVEDMVRNAAIRLRERDDILWFSVESENFESIHNHSAYAQIEMDLRK